MSENLSPEELYADCVVSTIKDSNGKEWPVYSQKKLLSKTKQLTGKEHMWYSFRYIAE